jgi:hypothetical protein
MRAGLKGGGGEVDRRRAVRGRDCTDSSARGQGLIDCRTLLRILPPPPPSPPPSPTPVLPVCFSVLAITDGNQAATSIYDVLLNETLSAG